MTTIDRYRTRFNRIGLASTVAEVIALIITAIVGASYCYLEFVRTRHVPDWPFVLLLTISTAVLLTGERIMKGLYFRYGLAFLAHADSSLDETGAVEEHARVSRDLYSSLRRIGLGIVYGALFVSVPFVLGRNPILPPTSPVVQAEMSVAMSVFLWLANFVTGNAIYTLAHFLFLTPSLSRRVKISIWQARNVSAEIYIQSILVIAFIASVYVSLSMTALLFSNFQHDNIYYGYIVFSFAVLIITLIYPYAPIVARLLQAKRELEGRLGDRLHELTEHVMSSVRANQIEQLLAEMRPIIELKSTVSQISVVPFRRVSVTALALMASVLSHPLVVEFAKSVVRVGGPHTP